MLSGAVFLANARLIYLLAPVFVRLIVRVAFVATSDITLLTATFHQMGIVSFRMGVVSAMVGHVFFRMGWMLQSSP